MNITKKFEDFHPRLKTILNRFVILIITILLYLIIFFCVPTSHFGYENTMLSLSNITGINPLSGPHFLLVSLLNTVIRFCISILLVVLYSFILIVVLHRRKWGLASLDHFSESLRTIPATAWAYPLLILPFLSLNSIMVFYIAITFSTSPILTLGLYKNMSKVLNSPVFNLAKINGVNQKKIIAKGFYIWLALRSIVQFKTTFALIFILVIVLEDVLSGGQIHNGLGYILGELRSETDFAANVFILMVLSFISISISSTIDLIHFFLKDLSE